MNVYWSKRRKNEIRYEDRVDVSCDGGWGGRGWPPWSKGEAL